jgi:hypothetical protein
MAKLKTKTLQICMTEAEMKAVVEAASRSGMTASQFGAKRVLDGVLGHAGKGEEAAVEEIRRFRRLFCAAMELSLTAKLTPERFQGLVERTGEQ